MMIDKDKLRELLADENANIESIYRGLGYHNDAAFYYNLKKDPEAKQLFADWRATHKRTPASSARRGNSPRVGRGAKRSTPPRNGNAKERISDELLRKLKHEFEHISLYQQVSEFFDELAPQVAALK